MATFIPDSSIRCENCHEVFYRYVEITNVIDTDRIGKFAIEAISGLVNRVVCPFCKAEFTFENPMIMYSNTSKIVCYTCYDVLPLNCRDFKLLAKITHCTDWSFRLCRFTMDASEKIRIFKDSLNDAAIEIIKLRNFPEYRNMILEDEYITYEKTNADMLCFTKRNDLDEIKDNLFVPISEYKTVLHTLPEMPFSQWMCIDRNWAIEYTEEKK